MQQLKSLTCRVGQNRIHTPYIWYSPQGLSAIYGVYIYGSGQPYSHAKLRCSSGTVIFIRFRGAAAVQTYIYGSGQPYSHAKLRCGSGTVTSIGFSLDAASVAFCRLIGIALQTHSHLLLPSTQLHTRTRTHRRRHANKHTHTRTCTHAQTHTHLEVVQALAQGGGQEQQQQPC